MADAPKPLPRGSKVMAEIAREEIQKLDALRAWAELPAHHWTRGRGQAAPPGRTEDRARTVVVLEGQPLEAHEYRVVFTITEAVNIGLVRHASVSSDGCRRPPPLIIAWTLLQRLGYRGNPDTWLTRAHPTAPHTLEIFEPFLLH
jgi:hypothetical protein